LPAPDPENPADPILAEIRRIQLTISNLSAYIPSLPKIKATTDRVELIVALRSCIDQLEDFYSRI